MSTRGPLRTVFDSLKYLTPLNLSYLWNYGSIAAALLGLQIVTGFLLALWYIPSQAMAFQSVEYIVREVYSGWLLRSLHANGASFFFFFVYLHMARALYYCSFVTRKWIWYSGMVIFCLMILTAFLGYVLPWGQMSFWAATVITGLLSTVPLIGNDLLLFVLGSLNVGQATLTRIYGAHFILPFVIAILVLVHLVLLHQKGSTNPISYSHSGLSFHPYFTSKDVLGLLVVAVALLFFVIYYPNVLSHPDNSIMANPKVTPLHIVPEWYFLPFYGMLRSVPNKLGGVIVVAVALIFLAFIPVVNYGNLIVNGAIRPVYQWLFTLFVFNCVLLGWAAGNPAESPYYELCVLGTVTWFVFFILTRVIIEIEGGLINSKTYLFKTLFSSSSFNVKKNITKSFIFKRSNILKKNKKNVKK